ncbi:alpha/beta fold hydrolase [Sutcliffiella rhizosphaerae]|uniref:2-succinyl-6-hydroxy-2, 4-cyclohexadiene-1-carboxylate synthase n=1 Tax=Sutcliffiella rhizosphaerae TaxID=2880967 RepID=A0ABM8YKE8_9BACI|nr:alpha/beta hydrolase [Sutcliffiella rhizosphaerae]CAG9620418.1 2-succinyl-6-hydroxy-2, 4-cyclohexadiene-1-carboxylate synthase [Sutcliffiella rhizosphaerae]
MILHTEILGEGEPIIFLHTGLQTGMTDFVEQREYFQASYKVILPDLRGHGKSKTNDISNFYVDSSDDLLETLNYFGVDSAHVVGCSIGALVGLFFAKRYPDKVKTLTLSGIMPKKPKNWSEIQEQSFQKQALLLENDNMKNYFNQLHGDSWPEFIHMAKNEDSYPFEEAANLAELEMHILFMVGEGNIHETIGAIYYPQTNEQVHVSIIPFASHLVHSEQPHIYNEILNHFLTNAYK